MPEWQGKRTLTVVTACMRADGLPDFALNQVEVTQKEHANGVQYDLVESLLKAGAYEEPFVHFDEDEAPCFLLPAVRQHLGLLTRIIVEEPGCHASSK
jgi:hypothetical protein